MHTRGHGATSSWVAGEYCIFDQYNRGCRTVLCRQLSGPSLLPVCGTPRRSSAQVLRSSIPSPEKAAQMGCTRRRLTLGQTAISGQCQSPLSRGRVLRRAPLRSGRMPAVRRPKCCRRCCMNAAFVSAAGSLRPFNSTGERYGITELIPRAMSCFQRPDLEPWPDTVLGRAAMRLAN